VGAKLNQDAIPVAHNKIGAQLNMRYNWAKFCLPTAEKERQDLMIAYLSSTDNVVRISRC
jgi:hypothetical protein